MEIIGGEPRRRRSDDEKRAIVAEAHAAGSVTATARRLGINPSMVFAWRKQFRTDLGCSSAPRALDFAPVALIADDGALRSAQAQMPTGSIEIEIGVDIRLRILGAAAPALAAALAKALASAKR